MYIDQSRQVDLLKLNEELNDTSKPMWHRRRIFKAKQRVLKQLNNPRITKERERLIKAYRAGDQYEAWKITNLIKNINREEQVEDWR